MMRPQLVRFIKPFGVTRLRGEIREHDAGSTQWQAVFSDNWPQPIGLRSTIHPAVWLTLKRTCHSLRSTPCLMGCSPITGGRVKSLRTLPESLSRFLKKRRIAGAEIIRWHCAWYEVPGG